MLVNSTVLKGILEAFVDRIDKTGDPEWIIPSFAKPNKMKCYVNVEKCTAIDFIGNRGLNALELIGEITGIEDRERVENFVIDWVAKNLTLEDVNDIISGKGERIVREEPLLTNVDLPEDAEPPYKHRKAMDYLSGRGLNREDIKRYRLLYSPSEKRIIIPFLEDGRVVWWQGRTIVDSPLRYTNPKGVKGSMFVYNIDAIEDTAVITEGPFDAMMVDGQATAGSRMSDWQVAKILSKKPKRVIFVPDIDFVERTGKSPGIEGAIKSIEKFVEREYSDIYVAINTTGKDLNDIGKQAAVELIDSARPLSFTTLLELKELGNVWSRKLEKWI